VVVAAVALLGFPLHAGAAPLHNLLPGGVSLGEVLGVDGETSSDASGSPCGYSHASIYRVTASDRSLLRVGVVDDQDGSLSLCSVAVYDAGSTSDALAASDECATASECALDHWLDAGQTYDVVFWAAAPEHGNDPDDASFTFDASVKLPTAFSAHINGERIKDLCTDVHEIRWGMPYEIRASSSSRSSGSVSFRYERKISGAWHPSVSYTRPMSNGGATLALKAGGSGLFRITVSVEETLTRLGASRTLYMAFVTPKWHRYSDGGVRLKVPWYRQQLRLSCESATLRMAHNYFKPGHIDSDWDVLKVIGVDDRPKRGNRWGNPNKTFVGKPNGRMMKTGYGVHWGPIAKASTRFSNSCRPAIVLARPSRATIARYVSMGFPVIVWGAHSGATGIYKNVWKAWDGDWVTAWSVEHVWVVVGFHGKPWKPTSFIVHNPSGSSSRKVSLRQFDAFTKYFKRAVVVRG
jgi:uncharacterized protein YvpB